MSIIHCQFIIYACPVGELNTQLENYFARSRELYGANAAHKYLPHCTLTGFFCDRQSSIPKYINALEKVYLEAKENNSALSPEINQLTFNDNWHGIELQSDRLKQLIVDFTDKEASSTRQEAIRLKDWLHLSLAYDFPAERGVKLKDLALREIDLNAAIKWQLRFYQKNPDWTWQCLQAWDLG